MLKNRILLIICLSVFIKNVSSAVQETPRSRVLKTITEITVVDKNKLRVKVHEDIVIAKVSDQYLGYDGVKETQFIKRKKLDAVIYDLTGKKIKELKKKIHDEIYLKTAIQQIAQDLTNNLLDEE